MLLFVIFVKLTSIKFCNKYLKKKYFKKLSIVKFDHYLNKCRQCLTNM